MPSAIDTWWPNARRASAPVSLPSISAAMCCSAAAPIVWYIDVVKSAMRRVDVSWRCSASSPADPHCVAVLDAQVLEVVEVRLFLRLFPIKSIAPGVSLAIDRRLLVLEQPVLHLFFVVDERGLDAQPLARVRFVHLVQAVVCLLDLAFTLGCGVTMVPATMMVGLRLGPETVGFVVRGLTRQNGRGVGFADA
jgi:hypothetical protein